MGITPHWTESIGGYQMTTEIMLVTQNDLDAAKVKLGTLTRESALSNFAKFLGIEMKSEKTIAQYQSQIKGFFVWCLDNNILAWQAVKPEIKAYGSYLNELRKAGKLSVSTANSRLVTVRRFFAALRENGYRTDNPCFGVKSLKDNSARVTKMKCLDQTAIKLLLDAAEKFTPKNKTRNQAAIVLMGLVGLRGFEVCNIQRKDIDEVKHSLLIHGKRGKDRIVGITPTQFKFIQALLAITPNDPNAYLFVNKSPKRGKNVNLQPRGLRLVIDTLLKKTSLKQARISTHSLRHTSGVALRKAGKSLQDIANLFGHDDINTTRIYTDYVDQIEHPITESLDYLLA